MALTLKTLESDNVDVPEAYLDTTDEGYFVLKQYPDNGLGDWIVLTPKMLDALGKYIAERVQ